MGFPLPLGIVERPTCYSIQKNLQPNSLNSADLFGFWKTLCQEGELHFHGHLPQCLQALDSVQCNLKAESCRSPVWWLVSASSRGWMLGPWTFGPARSSPPGLRSTRRRCAFSSPACQRLLPGQASVMASEAALLLEAVDFAARKHRWQRRKDPEETPYINHPIGGHDAPGARVLGCWGWGTRLGMGGMPGPVPGAAHAWPEASLPSCLLIAHCALQGWPGS